MSSDLKREYSRILWLRYQNADRRRKTAILDEYCRNTGLHRKYAIRLMHRVPTHFKKRPGKKRKYSRHAEFHLRKLWMLAKQVNAKKLKALMTDWLSQYVASSAVKAELLAMSASTMDRYLAPFRVTVARRRRSGTRPGRLLKHVIPIKPFDRTIDRPGHLEADTVAHCGNRLSGDFIWTVTVTDIYSGWTDCRAIWNKGSHGVLEALRDIEASLPFPILSFHSDNGSEFLNHAVLAYFSPEGEKKRTQMLMTRSREYRKNDNCHVEQKNWTRVRELFAYDRLGMPDLIPDMNALYRDVDGPLENFFIPQMKLVSKRRVGSRYQRRYDTPQTPYRRLLACPNIDEATKTSLRERFQSLNPFRLSRELRMRLNQFFKKTNPTTEEKVAA